MTIPDSGSARQDQLNRKLLRVLIVEDSPDDAELVEREISKAGYELASVRVRDWGAFQEALATRGWDVIIADYTIPGFGAVPALELLKQSNRDIPFIIVSGAISDETAVKSMRAGAHDYVLKNNLVRLVPAIEREVREIVTRKNKSQADTAVRYLSAIVESSDDAIIGKTLDGTITSWNRGAERLYGYAAAEVLGRSISILMPPRCSDELTLILQRVARGERIEQNDVARRRKDGTLVDVSLRISPILDKAGNIVGASTIARNITERKRAEEQIRHLASFPELNPNPVIETDLEGNLIYANPVARQQYGGLLQPKGQEPVFENWRSIIVALEAGGPHSMAREVKIGKAFFHQTIHYLPERNLVRFYFADITERKQQEEQSRKNEKEARARAIELAAVLDAVPAITFTAYDPECRRMAGNQAAYDLLRLPLGAIVSKSVPSQGRPSDFQFVQEGRELAPEELPVQLAARNGREVRNFEFSVVFEDGTSRDLFGHAVPLLDEAGLPRGAVGAFVDITERKRAEEELRESEKRYRTLFESIDEGFCVVELLFDEHGTANDMRYLEMNPASARHGIPAEVVGKTAREVLPNLEPCWFEMFGKVALTGESIRYVEHSEALNRWYEGNAFRIGEPEQHKVAILFQDISDKKRAEQALHESEARVRTKLESIVSPEGDVGNLELADIIDVPALQALFEDFYAVAHMPAAVIDLHGKVLIGVGWQDVCTRFHRVNPETCQYCVESDRELSTGVPAGQYRLYQCKNHLWDVATPIIVGGKHLGNVSTGQFFFDDEKPDLNLFREQARRFGFPEPEYLAAIERVPRLSREVLAAGMAYLMKLAEMISKLSYSNLKLARSLSERERLTAALQENEERLSMVVQASDLGTWDWDLRTGELMWSRRCLQMFGLSPDTSMTYEGFLKTIHPGDQERIGQAVRTAIEKRQDYDVEMRAVWPDGSVHWVNSRGRARYDESGKPVRMSGTTLDITQRKRTEQSLIRSEKLASVGRMAATMAHEINNPLASAMNALYLASTEPGITESALKSVELANTELELVAHITRQTLGFYRESGTPTAVNLAEVAEGILGLYGPKLRNKSFSVCRRFRNTGMVQGIEGELRQVISNLVANSIDAAREKATLYVRVSGPSALISGRSMVRLTIADNGSGISPENLKHIFEPFFTTKQAFGTGLGLWVTRELVSKHDGHIRVRSQVRKGTVFSICLPVERRQQKREEQPTAKDRGKRSIA